MAKKEPEFPLPLKSRDFLLHKKNLQKKLDKYEEDFAKKLKEISQHQKFLCSSLSSESENFISISPRDGKRDGNYAPPVLRKSKSQGIEESRINSASSRNCGGRKISEVSLPSKASSFPEQNDFDTTLKQSTNFKEFVQNNLELPNRQRRVLRRQQRIDSTDLHANQRISSSLERLSVSDFVNDQNKHQVYALTKSQQLNQDGESTESAWRLTKTEFAYEKTSINETEKDDVDEHFLVNANRVVQPLPNTEKPSTINADEKERIELKGRLSRNANRAGRRITSTEKSENMNNDNMNAGASETENKEKNGRLLGQTAQAATQRSVSSENSKKATMDDTEKEEVRKRLVGNANTTRHALPRLVNTKTNQTIINLKTNADEIEKKQMEEVLFKDVSSSQAAERTTNTTIKENPRSEKKLDEQGKYDKAGIQGEEREGRLFRNLTSLFSRPKFNNSLTTHLHEQTAEKKTHIKSVNDISRTTLERPISFKLTRNTRSLSPVSQREHVQVLQSRTRSKTFSVGSIESKRNESSKDFVLHERQVPRTPKETLMKEKNQYLPRNHGDAWSNPNETAGDHEENFPHEVSTYRNNSDKQHHKKTIGIVNNKIVNLREKEVMKGGNRLVKNNQKDRLLLGNNLYDLRDKGVKTDDDQQSAVNIHEKNTSLLAQSLRKEKINVREDKHLDYGIEREVSFLSNENDLQDYRCSGVKDHQDIKRSHLLYVNNGRSDGDSQGIKLTSINQCQADTLSTENHGNMIIMDRISTSLDQKGKLNTSQGRVVLNGRNSQLANQKEDEKRTSANQNSEDSFELDSVFSYSSNELQVHSTSTNQREKENCNDIDSLLISAGSEQESPTSTNQNKEKKLDGTDMKAPKSNLPLSKGWRKLQGVPLVKLQQLNHTHERDSNKDQETLAGFKDQSKNTATRLMSFRQVVMTAVQREKERKLEAERQKHLHRKERINEIQQPTESFLRQTMDKAVYHGYVPRPSSDQPQGVVKLRTVVTSLQAFRDLSETVNGNRMKRAERIQKRSNPSLPYTRKLELLAEEHKTDGERMKDVKGCRYLRVKYTLP